MTASNQVKLKPGDTIGILGGGQLGRMLAMAAARLGLRCQVFSPDPDSPAFDVVANAIDLDCTTYCVNVARHTGHASARANEDAELDCVFHVPWNGSGICERLRDINLMGKPHSATVQQNLPYIGLAAIGTALLQPTRRTEPPQSNPSNSRRAASASFLFMNETKPLSPAFLVRRVAVMSAPGP